jgi:hypothetical protein
MGNLQAQEYAELAWTGETSLRGALSWHLTSNHFPPVPTIMVEPCLEAIDNANAGDWDKLVSLPEGVGYRGLTVAPTYAMVEQHHLEAFLDADW